MSPNKVPRQAMRVEIPFTPHTRPTAEESAPFLKETLDLKSPKRKTAPRDAKPQRKAKAVPEQSSAILLSGGNPQISKGDGVEFVQAYIAAMPGWKKRVGERLDELISQTVPGVRKAVRWNTPFYGAGNEGWFIAFHCLTKYIKVSFFKGTSLRPPPPVSSKQKEVRYVHLFEDEEFDQRRLADWIRQAAKLPGEAVF